MKKHFLFVSIFFVLILSLGLVSLLKPIYNPVFATVSSCTASVDPSTIAMNSTEAFTFTINNTSAQNIVWVKITRPNTNFTLQGVLINGGFSSVSNFEDSKIFSSGTISNGGSTQIMFRATSGDQEVSSSNWSVTVSDDSGGANATTCAGSLGTEISGAGPDYTEPVLSAITLSSITSSSVTLSWTTDEPTTSYLDYGLDETTGTYLSTEDTLSTSHSYTLSGLSESTTYYFYVGNMDENENNSETEMSTFTTSAPGVTSEAVVITNTVVKTTTNTETRIISPTPTPTPIPDRTPPSVTIETDLSKAYDKPPTILGTASDSSGVVKIEYSLDDGRNYLSVDNISQPGARSTKFEFTPTELDDDNYKLKIRTQDGSPQFNIGITKEDWELIIDRLAPRFSGLIYSFGPHIMNPRIDGTLVAIAGIPFKITLSSVGGPTDVSIIWPEKNESAYLKLSKNHDNSLWSGELRFEEEGEHLMKYTAIDGADNKTETALNKVIVTRKGEVKGGNDSIGKEGKISVFYQEPNSERWVKWDGEAYSQKNPVKIDEKGNYSLFLPQGRYYLSIEVGGYQIQNSEFFEITEPTFINADFKLIPKKHLFALGPIRLYLPDFSTLSVPFKNNLPSFSNASDGKVSLGEAKPDSDPLVGSQIPYFVLDNFNTDSLRGKNSLITVFNSWSPQAGEQISLLNELNNDNFNILAIAEGENNSKAHIFGKRGQYSIPIIADEDAILSDPLRLNVLPVHYFLDRFGIVKDVKTGVLGKEEVKNLLNTN